MRQGRRPELLVPASSLEVLKTAVNFGADAVYIGGEAYGLRAKAKNFTLEEMAQGIALAHERGVKVYVTANILAHNEDLEGAREYFRQLRDMRPAADALIISDPGLFLIAREVWPEAEIHISTQANNTNYQTCLFWHRLGAKRVVCARELSLEEIRQIREKIPEEMELECFIHGAMCISYSGRCLLSNFLAGRDANRGACTHPCRWKYSVVEETRPGEYMPVYENDRGTFLFNSRDLCMIEHIPELAEAGIDSFKIEGRMKTALYVATVARTYRKAIDDYFQSEDLYRQNMGWYRAQIGKCTYRKFSTGFYFGKTGPEGQIYDESTYIQESVYLGTVEETAMSLPLAPAEAQTLPEAMNPPFEEEKVAGRFVRIEQRNKFCVGDAIEIMKPDGSDVPVEVLAMYDEEGRPVESAPHPKQKLWVELSGEARMGDLLRMEKPGQENCCG